MIRITGKGSKDPESLFRPGLKSRGYQAPVFSLCEVPFFNVFGDFMSFAPSVPEPVAQEFALQMIQRYVQELGGVPAYQKVLIRQAKESGGKLTWTPEERWAINRLGVRLPANIKIDGPPKYPD